MATTSKEGAQSIDEAYYEKNQSYYKFIKPLRDKEARVINKEIRKLAKERNRILRNIKKNEKG